MNLKIPKGLESKSIEIFAIVLFLALIINLKQSNYLFEVFSDSRKIQLLLFTHLLIIILLLVFVLIKIYKKTSFLVKLYNFFLKLDIPKGAKIAICVVFVGNAMSIILAKPLYPFYDVGMFRWNTSFKAKSEIVYNPKYYYYKNGIVKILDIRKESFYFLSEHLGLGYTHEFTFASTYHNKAQKDNFEFIMSELRERGIDTIWVGIHAVNYKTKKVWFNPNICNAININNNPNLHYGPIFIPEYQIKKCDEHRLH
ncbi:hypothetical protein [Flavobacterium piscis]|uniref:Uncharacterized protein n=1 Tax=Flavobacterium piscis TaxID=1114874 RepID=A0ABU1Y4I3_9FLAO|nr:hypothetical protein [Flavobacterium piscis]MDR7208968.1 hypothetical protein [Flavobacterium piscis]